MLLESDDHWQQQIVQRDNGLSRQLPYSSRGSISPDGSKIAFLSHYGSQGQCCVDIYEPVPTADIAALDELVAKVQA